MTRNVEVSTRDLISLADELCKVRAHYECVDLAVNDACTLEDANAIQSVMRVAHDNLNNIIDRLGILYGSPADGEAA